MISSDPQDYRELASSNGIRFSTNLPERYDSDLLGVINATYGAGLGEISAAYEGLVHDVVIIGFQGLCCTNPMRDSSRESSVVAWRHEQTDTPDVQDQELAQL